MYKKNDLMSILDIVNDYPKAASQTILFRKCGEKGGTYALVYTVQ